MDSASRREVIRIAFDTDKPSVLVETDWVVIVLVMLLLITFFFLRWRISTSKFWHQMEIEISGSPKAVFKIERNEENLYVANRIYIELTTRKAAIPIDEKNDVIEEIYDSWYKLFGIIRDELKALPGKYLRSHDATTALIGISRKILNEALRPHLTEHQSRFRMWLEKAKSDPVNNSLSPQELQSKYPDFDNLVASMKLVNATLQDYANELDKVVLIVTNH